MFNLSKNFAKKIRFFDGTSIKFFTVKNFTSNSIYETDKPISNVLSSGEHLSCKSPMEGVLGMIGACEIGAIRYYANAHKVVIEKIDVECKGDYDMDLFLEKRNDKNTFDFIDIVTTIKSSEKDKKKLEEVVNKGIQQCPVLSTLALTGMKINKKINYI